jgi:HPt (histidine-containing phosphotransfer) domain-containing protein
MSPTNTNDAAVMAVLERTDIAGLDINDALGRLNGSGSIFMRIIRSFVTNAPQLLTDLAEPTEQGLPDYAIKVHGLKGSLYGIGANAAGDAAKTLELASKAGDMAIVLRDNAGFIAQVNTLIKRLIELDAQVAAALDAAAGAGAGAPNAAADAPSKESLAKLLEATRCYDLDAMQEIIESLSSCTYASGGEDIAYIKEQFEAFAYDKVEERLEAII